MNNIPIGVIAILPAGAAQYRISAWFAGTGTTGESFVAYVEDNGELGTDDKFLLSVDGSRG